MARTATLQHCSKSEPDGDGFTVIADHQTIGGVELKGFGLIAADEHDVEAAALEHTGKLSLAGTERERTGGIIVGNVDGGIFAALIVVVGTLVFIELETAVLSGIDVEVDELGGALVAPLHLRTEGDDGTLAHEDGDALVGSVDDEPTA